MRTLTKSRVFVVSLNALVLAAFILWVWTYADIYLGENPMAEIGIVLVVVPALLVFGVILLVVGRRFRIPLLNRLIPFIGVILLFLYVLLYGRAFFPPLNPYLLNACIGMALSILTIATTVSIVRSKQNGSQTGKVRWLPKEDRMSRRKSVGIVAASIIVAIAVLVISLSEYGSVGGFPDRDLGRAIRGALNKTWGAVDVSELAGLTALGGSGGIHDLSGLEYCTNLTELWLDSNQINDISPLAGLSSLPRLCLSGNRISDISPLAKLTDLTELDLSGNQISDVSSLVENPGLSEGDVVILGENPLSSDSINIYIPQLEARGVSVSLELGQAGGR